MCDLLDIDNLLLLPIAIHRESSLDFLIYLVRPFQAFRALHMIHRLKSGNQYLKRLLDMPTTHTEWRLQGIRSKNLDNNLHQAAALIGQSQNVRSQRVI